MTEKAKTQKKGVLGTHLSYIQYITILAFLIAVGVALKTVSIYLSSTLKISFVFLTESITAILLGPIATIIQATLTDFIGAIVFPVGGAYNPAFTVSALFAGTITGLFLWKKVTMPRIILARVTINILVYTILNSIWMQMFYGLPFKIRVFTEMIKCSITGSAEIVLLIIILPVIARSMKQFGFNTKVSDNVKIEHLTTFLKEGILKFIGAVLSAVGLVALALNCFTLTFGSKVASSSYYGLLVDKLFPIKDGKKLVATLLISKPYNYILLIPIILAALAAVISILGNKPLRILVGALTTCSAVASLLLIFSKIGSINIFSDTVKVSISFGIILFIIAFCLYTLLPIIELLLQKKKAKKDSK